MHIVLTDILVCPECGEAQGLVARADRMMDRQIEEGALGCPVCRRQYPIRAGVVYLAGDAMKEADPDTGGAPDGGGGEAEAMRIAALLGLDRVNGFVLLAGSAARFAGVVSALAENVSVVTADSSAPGPASGSVSRLVIGAGLPFFPGKLRGIWLADGFADSHLEAATLALQPTARLVLDPAPADAEARLPAGFRVVARQDSTMVCERSS